MQDGSLHTVSERADFFRLLLKLYPEAIGIESLYQDMKNLQHIIYGVDAARVIVNLFILLVILRLAPTVDNLEWKRLNNESRRSTLLIGKTVGVDLFKSIVSFL